MKTLLIFDLLKHLSPLGPSIIMV